MAQEIGEPVTFAAITTLAPGGGSARASLAGILHAIPPNFADLREESAVASPGLPPLPQRGALPSPRAALDANENVLTADAKEVGVKNAAEETFRNQDILTIGRYAA